jgi:DNA-binding transcriptional MerR regulator
MASDRSRRPHNKAVSALLTNLRRASKPVRQHGRDVFDSTVAQMFDALAAPPVEDAGRGEYRMEELARLAGTTTRNIRLYRDRGLLDAPQRIGRLAIYNDSHLNRLRLIHGLLRRGYTISNVRELLEYHREGKTLADLLELPANSAASVAWVSEEPRVVPLRQAQDLIADPPAFERLTAMGLLRVDGDTATLVRPTLIDTLNELRVHGISMDQLLDLHERVLPLIGEISDVLVQAGAEYAAELLASERRPADDTEFADLVASLIAFGPLALTFINGTLTAKIRAAAQTVVGRMVSDFVHESGSGAGPPRPPSPPGTSPPRE